MVSPIIKNPMSNHCPSHGDRSLVCSCDGGSYSEGISPAASPCTLNLYRHVYSGLTQLFLTTNTTTPKSTPNALTSGSMGKVWIFLVGCTSRWNLEMGVYCASFGRCSGTFHSFRSGVRPDSKASDLLRRRSASHFRKVFLTFNETPDFHLRGVERRSKATSLAT